MFMPPHVCFAGACLSYVPFCQWTCSIHALPSLCNAWPPSVLSAAMCGVLSTTLKNGSATRYHGSCLFCYSDAVLLPNCSCPYYC